MAEAESEETREAKAVWEQAKTVLDTARLAMEDARAKIDEQVRYARASANAHDGDTAWMTHDPGSFQAYAFSSDRFLKEEFITIAEYQVCEALEQIAKAELEKIQGIDAWVKATSVQQSLESWIEARIKTENAKSAVSDAEFKLETLLLLASADLDNYNSIMQFVLEELGMTLNDSIDELRDAIFVAFESARPTVDLAREVLASALLKEDAAKAKWDLVRPDEWQTTLDDIDSEYL